MADLFAKPQPKWKTKQTVWYHWLTADSFKIHSGVIKKREFVGVTGLGMFWRYVVVRDDGYKHDLVEGQMFSTRKEAEESREHRLHGYIANAKKRIAKYQKELEIARYQLDQYTAWLTDE